MQTTSENGAAMAQRSLVLAGLFVLATTWSSVGAAQEVSLVRSGDIDASAGTVTLPLREGRMTSGESVWYLLLDSSDGATSERMGINFSDKLSNAGSGGAVRTATLSSDGKIVFAAGRVNFAPARKVQPGPENELFPPTQATPGSVGDEDCTPLMRVGSDHGTIFNAPVLAFDVDADTLNRFCASDADHAVVHDKVVRICPRDSQVTLTLTDVFAAGHRISYVSTESNFALVAALEGATHAPRLGDVPADRDDAPRSAVEPIFVVINVETGAANPARQGLTSALADGLGPLNVIGDVPGLGLGYSPLWASHPVVWADKNGEGRLLLTSEAQIRAAEAAHLLNGFDGGAVRSDGILVNCPVISRHK